MQPHSFLKSVVVVGLAGGAVILSWVILITCVRHTTRTANAMCPGIDPSAFNTHNDIVNNHTDILQEWEGEWYVQATNNWFMNGFVDFRGDCKVNADGSVAMEWKWFNSYFLSSSRVVDRIHSPKGRSPSFFLNVVEPENVRAMGSAFCPPDRPIIVLDYKPSDYLILYDCGITGVPEGSLFVMTRGGGSDEYLAKVHERARELADQYHIDTLFYTVIPQLRNGLPNYIHAISDNAWKLFMYFVLLYVALCHLMPFNVTILQSFSYSTLFSWNFGKDMFNLQTALMFTYHENLLAILTHSTILFELPLWYAVAVSFAKDYFRSDMYAATILAGIVAIQALQLVSYKDLKFGIITLVTYVSLAVFSFVYLAPAYTYYCQLLLVVTAILRVIGHSAEPFPPILSGEDAFISIGKLPLIQKLKIPLVILWGTVSECAVGMPTRGFPYVFYLVLSWVGYSSPKLISLQKCAEIDMAVKQHGWKGYPPLLHAMTSQKGLILQ